MTFNGFLQILLYFLVILAVTKPIGLYMYHIFSGDRTWLHRILRPLERLIYASCGIRETDEMRWTTYAFSLLAFNMLGLGLTYLLLRLQGFLPLNPQGYGTNEMTPDLAFNMASSMVTNTNWQSYVPETTLSYFSNMVAVATQNWTSAATGIAAAIAIIRGFSRRSSQGIGNCWVDMTRATLYVLLPISLVYAIFLVAQGVPQNLDPYTSVTTLEGATQKLAQGPVASQVAIKMLGTNGGGFYNANSAHPFENPNPLVNFVQLLSIFLIPAGLTFTFGKMVGNTRQGWAVFGAMSLMFLTGLFFCYWAEQSGNPLVARAGIETRATDIQSGGNMEGKETRFGIAASTLFAAVTTGASCGAVNSMHDSFTPLGGMIPLLNIMSGEVIFGGVGAGLYGILMFAIIAVFIAGLMVGRTPEYLGKKIEQFEVKMAIIAILILDASILGFATLGANLNLPEKSPLNRVGTSETYYGATYNNINNSGPHGLSEILYAYTSATGNNGSAFAGITANTPFYNVTLGLAMLIGRYFMLIPLLAMAGSLAAKASIPISSGTFPTDTITFALLLVGTVLLVGALTYFPVLALAPIVEYFKMMGGKLF